VRFLVPIANRIQSFPDMRTGEMSITLAAAIELTSQIPLKFFPQGVLCRYSGVMQDEDACFL
jgi:hypothetical protein